MQVGLEIRPTQKLCVLKILFWFARMFVQDILFLKTIQNWKSHFHNIEKVSPSLHHHSTHDTV